MRRIVMMLTLAAALAAVLVMSAIPAFAVTNFANAPSGAHYRQGSAEPVCTVNTATNTVSCTGTTLGGVGNTNATVALRATATANFVCHNPGNENIVEPHSRSFSASTSQTVFPSRNGQLIIPSQSVTLDPAAAAAQFTCPNPNWTEEFTGFGPITYTYTVTFNGFNAPVISLP
jgi:hypothetical protein